ncbi:hypothetical protein GCM10010123_06300 [Pilimelia anulata]|uniref:DUF1416 domain-containing protein n=1 Tax=Pilimelia anulata TaxID=53371 RepID=A0A8J3B243_9ACTN|nr:DUF1416 domain-containing protein [Pilimelia anulata]GGJ79119.1 hypothetical protein GCM10010123_06300 [Pilimelia anulata]
MTQVSSTAGCAAPDQGAGVPASVDLATATVIAGVVRGADGEPVAGAYVRLLDANEEFTAEVVTSPAGQFRFFAAPGTWSLRALAAGGDAVLTVSAVTGTNAFDLHLA